MCVQSVHVKNPFRAPTDIVQWPLKRSWKLDFPFISSCFLPECDFLIKSTAFFNAKLLSNLYIVQFGAPQLFLSTSQVQQIQIPGFVGVVTCNMTLQEVMEFNINYMY